MPGFWTTLSHHELRRYFFLILVADRQGISYHSYICKATELLLEKYLQARNALIDTDLLAFDGFYFQVLSLPESPSVQQDKAEEFPSCLFPGAAPQGDQPDPVG